MLHGQSHVLRNQIRSLCNSVCRTCHLSLNVRIKEKKKKITPRIVSLGACNYSRSFKTVHCAFSCASYASCHVQPEFDDFRLSFFSAKAK